MSEEESEEELESSNADSEDESESSTLIQQKKDNHTDLDIELLRNISEYINRTTTRLSKRLLLEEMQRKHFEVKTSPASSQTEPLSEQNTVPPPHPPREGRSSSQPQSDLMNRPHYNISPPLAF